MAQCKSTCEEHAGSDVRFENITQPRPQGFSLEKWVGREKALASAGHVYSLNIPRS